MPRLVFTLISFALLVGRADVLRRRLRSSVVREEAVQLSLHVGQLRPDEPGDIAEPSDQPTVLLCEPVRGAHVLVREVLGARNYERDAAALADPERQPLRRTVLAEVVAVVV